MKDKVLQLGINTYKRAARYHAFTPRQVKVEVTKACNLYCAGCRRNFLESIAHALGPMHLTVDMLDKAIKDLPVKMVRFTGDGEPFCNPYLGDLLQYLRKKGIWSAMTTNGTLVDKEQVRYMEDNKVFRVSVSFDGAEKETFEYLRGGAKYEQVLDACKLLGRSKIQLYMNCLLSTDGVIEQLPEYLRLAKGIGATGIHLMKYQSQDEDIWELPNWSKHEGMLEKATREAKSMGLLLSAPYYGQPTFVECEDPYTAPWVTLSGDVFPCVYIANMREYEVYQGEKVPVPWRNYIMGNTNKENLRIIWKNSAYKELRQVLKDTSWPMGYSVTRKELLRKKDIDLSSRFGYCAGCPCRWSEAGI